MSDVEDLVAEASNELTPADSLARLGRSRNATVRRAVAANPLTPPEALGRLVRDDDQAVLSAVARNPATPAAALWTLARDNAALRGTIAGNASVPPDLLAALVADEDKDVRFWSTFNPHISDEALESLIEDPHSKVRTRAAQALQARREVQRQRDHGRPPRPDAGAEPATAAATTTPDGTVEGGLWEQPPGGPDVPGDT